MDCAHCSGRVNGKAEYFELHHHQAGSDAVLQRTFCSFECLREQLFDENELR